MNVVELSIAGNSKQDKREGYNILKVTRDNFTKNGVTFTNNQDGSFTLDGTATSTFYIELNNDDNNRFTLIQNKKYFIYCISTSANINMIVRTLETASGIGTKNYDVKEWTGDNSENGYVFITVNEGTTFNNETFYPMLAESDVELEYEAYGAMPSPLYPSKVETVNTQASVVVSNKNFFDKDTMKIVKVFLNYDTTAKENFKLITAGSEDYICYIVPLPKAIRNFTISAETFGNRGIGCGFVEYPKLNMEADQYFFSNNNYKGGSYTANEDINYVMLFVCNDGVEPVNLMIEEGNTATEYVPFMLQTKTVEIQQDMLQGDYFVKEEDGWKEVHGWNKQVLDGTQETTYFDAPGKEQADSLDTAYYTINPTPMGQNDQYVKENIKSNYFKNLYTGSQIWGKAESTSENLLESIALQEKIRLRIKKERLTGYTNDLTNTEKVTLLNNYLQQQYNSGNPVYVWYKLATPTKLACTERQSQQLDDLLNTSTYKNVTHIYSTDKVSPVIKIKYRKDIETMFNTQQSNYDTRLSNIEKLLSTTTTSSTLLNNLQKDIESEVI